MRDSHRRSVAKALTWRILASLTTVGIVWVFTGEMTVAFSVGAIEAFIKMLIYYAHERSWNTIPWGRAADD